MVVRSLSCAALRGVTREREGDRGGGVSGQGGEGRRLGGGGELPGLVELWVLLLPWGPLYMGGGGAPYPSPKAANAGGQGRGKGGGGQGGARPADPQNPNPHRLGPGAHDAPVSFP
jgi:hypothetical protein